MTTLIEIPKEGFAAIKQYGQQPLYFFRFDAEETEDETVMCKEASIMLLDAVYERMVSACIGVKYTADAQMALLFNYQLDPTAYAEAMREYQEWRAYCKEACREYFGIK